jgi:septal ring factor EnvC (AmiA/AmiB activator)
MAQSQQFLEVSGNTIWIGSREVARITLPESTSFFDEVVDMVNNSNTAALEEAHEEALEDIQTTHQQECEGLEETINEKDQEISDLEYEVYDLENTVAELKGQIAEIQTEAGVAEKVKEMEERILGLQKQNTELLVELQKWLPKTKRKYTKRTIYRD